jgi:hypothetical protein
MRAALVNRGHTQMSVSRRRQLRTSRGGGLPDPIALIRTGASHEEQSEPERDAPTHWIDYDAPVTRGRAQASCGVIVAVRQFSQRPTCPACQRQQGISDTFQF